MNLYAEIIKEIKCRACPKKAAELSRFFKTGKGQYGEGDQFLGLVVPVTRGIVKRYYKQAGFKEVKELLKSPYHEARLCGLLLLVAQFEQADDSRQQEIYEFYMRHLRYANNWDLVDLSCYKIAGAYLYGKDPSPLYTLSKSDNLWLQRVAMVSTLYMVKKGDLKTALDLAEHFLTHPHDLMHKAAGWILREVGKKDKNALCRFLDQHHQKMPRTMLRYSIEKLSPVQKAHYLKKDAAADKKRCDWCQSDPLYMEYHDKEWGKEVKTDRKMFEFLTLESAQAGLSWITILKRRKHYRRAFANFDVRKVAAFTTKEVERLMNDEGIIRNRRKIEAAISNARAFIKVQQEFGSFCKYLRGFLPDGKPVVNYWKSCRDIPARSELSDAVSKDMKKRGFSFFGTVICYAHLQAVGYIDDHIISCFTRQVKAK